MPTPPSPSPWTPLAALWDDLFPLRPPRLDLALGLSAPGAPCLDAGCATGSLPRALAAQGRVAHGLDLDPDFLAVARRRALAAGLPVTWHAANLLDLAAATAPARFRLITCLGQTLPHLLEEDQWLAFFRQAWTALEPGGHLVVQVVQDPPGSEGRARDLTPASCPGGTLERRRTPLSATLTRFDLVFRPAQGEPVASQVLHRRMDPARARELMAQAGLEPGDLWADEAGHPYSPDAPGWVLLARRS